MVKRCWLEEDVKEADKSSFYSSEHLGRLWVVQRADIIRFNRLERGR